MSALRQRLALSSPSIIHTPVTTLIHTHTHLLLLSHLYYIFNLFSTFVSLLKLQDFFSFFFFVIIILFNILLEVV